MVIDRARGIAWERDLDPMAYDAGYFHRYEHLDASPMGSTLNRLRVELVSRHMPAAATLIDVGIGGGAFVTAARAAGFDARGHDASPAAIDWLLHQGLYLDPYQCGPAVAGLTLWDVLEHLPNPDALFAAIRPGRLLFLAIPICPDLRRLPEWKHYRPREHLWHWTAAGFDRWIWGKGFSIVESSNAETLAGREDIRSYALRRL